MSSAIANDVIVWEWFDEYLRWRPYSAPVSNKIEMGQRAGKAMLNLGTVEPKVSFYDVDFMLNVQRRRDTGTERQIRRTHYSENSAVAANCFWYWEGDVPGSFHQYDFEVNEILESHYNIYANSKSKKLKKLNLSTQSCHLPYTIDFKHMTQKRIETKKVRSIERNIVSNVQPYMKIKDKKPPKCKRSSSSAATGSAAMDTTVSSSHSAAPTFGPHTGASLPLTGIGSQTFTHPKSASSSRSSSHTGPFANTGATFANPFGHNTPLGNGTTFGQASHGMSATGLTGNSSAFGHTFGQSMLGMAGSAMGLAHTLPARPFGGDTSTGNTTAVGGVLSHSTTTLGTRPATRSGPHTGASLPLTGIGSQTFTHPKSASSSRSSSHTGPFANTGATFANPFGHNTPLGNGTTFGQASHGMSATGLTGNSSAFGHTFGQSMLGMAGSAMGLAHTLPARPFGGDTSTGNTTAVGGVLSHSTTTLGTRPATRSGPHTGASLPLTGIGSQTFTHPKSASSSRSSSHTGPFANTGATFANPFGHNTPLGNGTTFGQASHGMSATGLTGNSSAFGHTFGQSMLGMAGSGMGLAHTLPARPFGGDTSTGNTTAVGGVLSHSTTTLGDSDASFNQVIQQYTSIIRHPPKDEDCCICMTELTERSGQNDQCAAIVKLKCSHMLHKSCLKAMYDSGTQDGSIQCPTCKAIFRVKFGNCPPGEMTYRKYPGNIPGHPNCGVIQIQYNIQPGVQGPEHPSPGECYVCQGFPRGGFLPDNEEGQQVLRLLIKAWQRRLTFTVATSVTTGLRNAVVWNEIHHKTEIYDRGGHGYPDDNYLSNVKMELASQGVMDSDEEAGEESEDEDL